MFDQRNSPGLDPRIEKLMLDIENLNMSELSNLWGMLSGRYLPSVLYKVRMVSFNGNDFTGQVPHIAVPDASVGGRP